MENPISRVEIVVSGLVQGVGFRYFVLRNALDRNIKGYTKNLYNGEVYTVAEGSKDQLEIFAEKLKHGPQHAQVTGFNVKWTNAVHEFNTFEIKR